MIWAPTHIVFNPKQGLAVSYGVQHVLVASNDMLKQRVREILKVKYAYKLHDCPK